MKTRIGVVTPTLDAERFLERTLESIWGQDLNRFEIDHVIVDGGSKDGTLAVAARYPSRVVQARDGGMYEAINRGMALVGGDVVGYINADDEIASGALSLVVDALDREPGAQWVCGRLEYIDGDGSLLAAWTPIRPTVRSYAGIGWSCIPQQTVWARRSFFDQVGLFDPTFRHCGDYDWYVRALRQAPPLVLPQPLGRFRLHDSNLSWDLSEMTRQSRLIQERYGGRTPAARVAGKVLSLRLNAKNPAWLWAKKTGRVRFDGPVRPAEKQDGARGRRRLGTLARWE